MANLNSVLMFASGAAELILTHCYDNHQFNLTERDQLEIVNYFENVLNDIDDNVKKLEV